MLRILIEQHGTAFTLSLHGTISGAWVAVLERSWRSIVETVPSARVTAVLSDISFIDAEGERMLERMCGCGVELVASGCMNRYVIDKIQGLAP